MKTFNYIKMLLSFLLIAIYLQANEPDDNKFKVSKNGKLIVKISNGDITINTWTKDEVYIRADNNSRNSGLELSHKNNTIYIENDYGSGSFFDGSLIVTVPQSFNIEAITSNGDIEIKNKIVGNIKLKTMSGDINVNDINGHIDLNTMGGNIVTKNIEGTIRLLTSGGEIIINKIVDKNFRVNTYGGDIQINEIVGNGNVATNGGEIRIKTIRGDVKTVTYGGDLYLTSIDGDFSGETKGGNIDVNHANGKINVITYGGDITIKKSTHSVNAKTNSGNIYVEMNPKTSGKSSLESLMGDIILIIPESASADINATVIGFNKWADEDDSVIISDYKAYSDNDSRSSSSITKKFKLNSGAEFIKIKAMNSTISIKKR